MHTTELDKCRNDSITVDEFFLSRGERQTALLASPVLSIKTDLGCNSSSGLSLLYSGLTMTINKHFRSLNNNCLYVRTGRCTFYNIMINESKRKTRVKRATFQLTFATVPRNNCFLANAQKCKTLKMCLKLKYGQTNWSQIWITPPQSVRRPCNIVDCFKDW